MRPGGAPIGQKISFDHFILCSFFHRTRICNSFFSVSKNENSRPILLIFLCWGPMDPETLSPETVYSLKTARDNHVLFSENERGQNFTKSHQSFLDSMER